MLLYDVSDYVERQINLYFMRSNIMSYLSDIFFISIEHERINSFIDTRPSSAELPVATEKF